MVEAHEILGTPAGVSKDAPMRQSARLKRQIIRFKDGKTTLMCECFVFARVAAGSFIHEIAQKK